MEEKIRRVRTNDLFPVEVTLCLSLSLLSHVKSINRTLPACNLLTTNTSLPLSTGKSRQVDATNFV